MLARSLIVSLVVTVGCAGARPAANATPAPAPAAVAPSPLFSFHVGFWINLHQRLYAESGARPVPDPLRAAASADQAAWDAALAFYRQRYPERGLLTPLANPELVRVNHQLGLVEAAADLGRADLPAELRALYEQVAPVYRRALWADDEAADHAFVARLTPLVQRFGPSLVPTLSRAYQSPWPAAPIRVDVSRFAGPLGAYTIDTITIAARDPRHEGDAVLEILFHESSHLLIKPVIDAIEASCAAHGRPVPPTLWHAVLFFATGEIVRRQLGGDHVAYADRNGLWQRSPDWAAYRPLLGRVWPGVLDGTRPLRAAVDELVAALP